MHLVVWFIWGAPASNENKSIAYLLRAFRALLKQDSDASSERAFRRIFRALLKQDSERRCVPSERK
jgi:hypothetical protein